MSPTLRASNLRLIGGAALALAGIATAIFLLPDASKKQLQTEKALKDASSSFDRQVRELRAVQAESESA